MYRYNVYLDTGRRIYVSDKYNGCILRKIIAWKLTKIMEVEEVLKCLEEAKRREKQIIR